MTKLLKNTAPLLGQNNFFWNFTF